MTKRKYIYASIARKKKKNINRLETTILTIIVLYLNKTVNKQTGKLSSRTSIRRKQQEERTDEEINRVNHQTKQDEQALRLDQ